MTSAHHVITRENDACSSYAESPANNPATAPTPLLLYVVDGGHRHVSCYLNNPQYSCLSIVGIELMSTKNKHNVNIYTLDG